MGVTFLGTPGYLYNLHTNLLMASNTVFIVFKNMRPSIDFRRSLKLPSSHLISTVIICRRMCDATTAVFQRITGPDIRVGIVLQSITVRIEISFPHVRCEHRPPSFYKERSPAHLKWSNIASMNNSNSYHNDAAWNHHWDFYKYNHR